MSQLLQTALVRAMALAGRALPRGALRTMSGLPVLGLPATSRLAWLATEFPGTTRGALLAPVGAPCGILAHMHALRGAGEDFSGRRVALLAHHDPHGLVDPYVAHYLRGLRRLGYATVLVSDREPGLSADTSTGISEWADAVLWRSCPGYDFTSWKGALEFFPSIAKAGELLVTNDSVFAPTNPLEPVHARMDALDCDFWGLSESGIHREVLQSYYLVFRRTCLDHPAFWTFWSGVDTGTDRRDVIARYECTLTSWLARNGLRAAAFLPARGFPRQVPSDPMSLCWRFLQRDFGFPCVKRGLLAGDTWWVTLDGWEEVLAATGYPVRLITDYFRRVKKG